MKLTPALAGGASLSVLVLAVMSTAYIQTATRDGGAGGTAPRQTVRLPDFKVEERFAPLEKPKSEGDARARNLTDMQAMRQTAPTALARNEPVMPLAPPAPSSVADEAAAPAFAGRIAAESERRDFDRSLTQTYRDQGRDRFATIADNPVRLTREEPVSTFSIDVDTASYAFLRASLASNVLPQRNALRVEELINYFPYDYAAPEDAAVPFRPSVSVFPAPWNADRKLVHIGIKGFEMKPAERPAANLVFLLDTSGSMNAPNKLPLVRNAMKLLLDSLEDDDTVAIVTYAGGAGTVLEPTRVRDRARIFQALDNLHSAGSTAGAEGIRQAYDLARANFAKDGVNRVILATDGDFNVGITDVGELRSYIERQRDSGIFLSVLGFGMGNYNDELMQALAQNGNGNAAYIDSLNEARKVLVEEASSTLFTIARDVKIQVEFNPLTVAEYRLIGYETRLLNREDFNNDKVDAGDIGAGHTVTALYEITPAGSGARLIDELRYGAPRTDGKIGAKPGGEAGAQGEYAFLKIRYKLPGEDRSRLITTPIAPAFETADVASAPQEARFATAVAAFGQILTGGRYTGSFSLDDVIALAQGAKGADEFGYRAEFVNLARLAKSAAALEPLDAERSAPTGPAPRN